MTAYLAQFQGASFDFLPMSGTTIVESDGDLAAGFTEYGASGGGAFQERTRFHRVRCSAGSDGKLGELDSCSDITWDIPQNVQTGHSGHVIPCLPLHKIP